MKKHDLMVAADRALSLLASMSDEELMLALEQSDASLAYAVNCYASRDIYSFAATNLRLSSGGGVDPSIYMLLSNGWLDSLTAVCLREAMNDDHYALAA